MGILRVEAEPRRKFCGLVRALAQGGLDCGAGVENSGE